MRGTTRRALGWTAVLGAALVAFALQASSLHVAAAPYTDEGVYAEVGRRIFAGERPHANVPLFHMPLRSPRSNAASSTRSGRRRSAYSSSDSGASGTGTSWPPRSAETYPA